MGCCCWGYSCSSGGCGAWVSHSLPTALIAFIATWLLVTVVNLWVGVSKAGYAMREELPILLLVFTAPALLAGFLYWRLAR